MVVAGRLEDHLVEGIEGSPPAGVGEGAAGVGGHPVEVGGLLGTEGVMPRDGDPEDHLVEVVDHPVGVAEVLRDPVEAFQGHLGTEM